MPRAVSPEHLAADYAARRYVMSQLAHCWRMYFPRQAAFAAQMGKGAIDAPTPDDPLIDAVGDYMAIAADPLTGRIVTTYYSVDTTMRERANIVSEATGRRLDVNEYWRVMRRFWRGLSGFLVRPLPSTDW